MINVGFRPETRQLHRVVRVVASVADVAVAVNKTWLFGVGG